MKAYIFPGQAAQFEGMGKDLYDSSTTARDLLEQANQLLGFRITDVMFGGTMEDLKQTKVTQPAVFLHSIVKAILTGDAFQPNAVAGHSLGEFSALVAAKAMSFENGLMLVYKRALAMQKACEQQPSTMAAILGLEDEVIEHICAGITDEIVVPANYNCPGQLVISGTVRGIELAVAQLTAAGAKRAIVLEVGGAFHSPLMQPAQDELAAAIAETPIKAPICPIYQNVNATPERDPERIKQNLISQLTAPVRWTQTVQHMLRDGITEFVEVGGTGKVLQSFVKKVERNAITSAL
ncbi:MAG TPA: ACP S-malonyltransferase [Saprospiraceae bacterium]|nr:ACP S-malonyltransferase [Saprospiraceae bacterium]HMP12775.1 ACP S-malonyltransferase [Saprospiraceae bacterium]